MPMNKDMSNPITNDHANDQARADAVEVLRDYYMTSQRIMNRLLAQQGTSFAKTKMMQFIHRYGQVRSADLVGAFGFAPRTITEAIDALEKDGLVTRVADAADRRVKHISLTAAGVTLLQQAEPVRKGFRDQLFEVFSDQETEQLADLVGRLNARMRELEEKLPELLYCSVPGADGKS